MDLFKDIGIPHDKLNPNFIRMKEQDFFYEKNLLNKWSEPIINRDGSEKFIKEFQTTFNSCFWEIYLSKLFSFYNLSVNYKYCHPDFVINDFGGINVEVVTANHSIDGTPEYSNVNKEFSPPNLQNEFEYELFLEDLIIRLSNAIDNKLKKYCEKYSKEDYVKNKPYIIAVAPFDRPYFYYQGTEAIRRLLYGCKHNLFTGEFSKIKELKKNNGAIIDLGVFDKDKYSNISGIIYSDLTTFSKLQALSEAKYGHFIWARFNSSAFGKPKTGFDVKREYYETVEDGINIFLNPKAKYPIPRDFYNLFQTIFFDGELDKIKVEDGALLFRQQISFTFF